MKENLILAAALFLVGGSLQARVWTDVKGREIDAEYVSQSEESVVLRLRNKKEVTVLFKTLSREDLAYLIELEIAEAKKNGGKPEKPEAGTPPAEKPGDDLPPDPSWDRPVPRKAVLKEPLSIEEVKKEDHLEYSSANFRIVADDRLSDKAVQAILEAGELTKIYCESLPFGLDFRYPPVEGKYQVETFGNEKDWIQAGGARGLPTIFDPESGKFKMCLESLGLAPSGRGSDDQMRYLAGRMIMHVSSSTIPEIYSRNLKDWFNIGFPNLINCAVYDEGILDFTEIEEETKDLLLGKSRSGQKPLFKKEVEMLKLDDLTGQTMAGPEGMDERRRFAGQAVLLMGYLMFMDDDGKATGLRNGLRFASEFEKNLPKEIRASSQEEADRIIAELNKERRDMGLTALKKILRERSLEEVEKEMAAKWEPHGLRLVFGEDAEE